MVAENPARGRGTHSERFQNKAVVGAVYHRPPVVGRGARQRRREVVVQQPVPVVAQRERRTLRHRQRLLVRTERHSRHRVAPARGREVQSVQVVLPLQALYAVVELHAELGREHVARGRCLRPGLVLIPTVTAARRASLATGASEGS